MVYLIDNRLMFRPEDGALWPSGDEDAAVTLTLTMSRLLACLLDRHGEAITRNDLLDSVWDAHGLRSSSHTLNKYISELRKHFVQMGIADECITTLPRVGFMFNSDIDVRAIAEPAPGGVARTDNEALPAVPVIHRARPVNKYTWLYYTLALCIIITSVALVVSGLAIRSEPPYKLQALTPNFLFNFGSCPVYTVESNSVALAEQKKILFTALAESNHIPCLEGASFLYQVSESYLYGSTGRAFISRCTHKNNEYVSCLNYYWSGYERHQ
ncbi:winged helix-turn-helix domain-containing protein [Enterobacter ludwigii]